MGDFVEGLFLIVVMSAVMLGVNVVLAQGVVWALAMYHIPSGLGAPLLLLIVFQSAVTGGVSMARQRKR